MAGWDEFDAAGRLLRTTVPVAGALVRNVRATRANPQRALPDGGPPVGWGTLAAAAGAAAAGHIYDRAMGWTKKRPRLPGVNAPVKKAKTTSSSKKPGSSWYTKNPRYQRVQPARRQYKTASNSSRSVRSMPKRQRNVRTAGYLDVEKKFFDVEVNGTNVPNTLGATVFKDTLVAMAQGSAANQRVGNKIFVHQLHMRGLIRTNGSNTAANSSNVVRIIIYQDRQANAATAKGTDILKDLSTADDFLSFRDLEQSGRFYILADRQFSLEPHTSYEATTDAGNVYYNTVNKTFTYNRIFKNPIRIDYTGSTPSVADLAANNIGVLAIASGNNVSTLEFVSRIRYTD